MTTHCPHCQVPLDPTHAPVARIRGAKVVTFCSAACADADARGEAPPERDDDAPVAAVAVVDEPPRPVAQVIDEPELSEPISSPDIRTAEPSGNVEKIDLSDDRPRVKKVRSPARQRRRMHIMVVLSAILLGGMAIAIIDAVSPSKPSTAKAETEVGRVASPEGERRADAMRPKPAPARTKPAARAAQSKNAKQTIDPQLLYKKAIDDLHELLLSNSPRVRREAAMALARIKDKKALALLRKSSQSDASRLVQIQVAYALARAGDVDGRATLVKALHEKRLDVRLDAAKNLIRLGDKRGREQLWGMMGFKSFKLGAAEWLARIGDEHGLKILKKALVHKYRKAIRMRAAVALGLAGDDSVRDKLRKIVKERHYRVRAAYALAALKDEAAAPELIAQLDMPSLRVYAALALRRLGHPVKLEPVAAGLAKGSDISKIKAAEAIMILVGPKQLAERD